MRAGSPPLGTGVARSSKYNGCIAYSVGIYEYRGYIYGAAGAVVLFSPVPLFRSMSGMAISQRYKAYQMADSMSPFLLMRTSTMALL